jgi:hypothetical protein
MERIFSKNSCYVAVSSKILPLERKLMLLKLFSSEIASEQMRQNHERKKSCSSANSRIANYFKDFISRIFSLICYIKRQHIESLILVP